MQSDISGCIFATENLKTKTTNISYSGSLLNKTTISNNCFITNLQCGNINTYITFIKHYIKFTN